jgi:pantoate--beta-alanine ligase
MVIFKKINDLQHYLNEQRKQGYNISFVPTMGALHKGHRSLVEKGRTIKDTIVVCSIFVNPTQFNEKEDFDKYPTSIEADIELLIEADCDVLFLPSVHEVYPNGIQDNDNYDFGELDKILEGAHRPGHFKGVGQVVSRLLQIVQPNYLLLGQKDYQQCMVIKKLLELTVLNNIHIVICPTVREADGLAMSSRNVRLTETQRLLAATIYQCLVSIQSKQAEGDFTVVQKECIDLLTRKGFTPEYVALANANDLTLLDNYTPDTPMVALIATKLGTVRLIDNVLV